MGWFGSIINGIGSVITGGFKIYDTINSNVPKVRYEHYLKVKEENRKTHEKAVEEMENAHTKFEAEMERKDREMVERMEKIMKENEENMRIIAEQRRKMEEEHTNRMNEMNMEYKMKSMDIQTKSIEERNKMEEQYQERRIETDIQHGKEKKKLEEEKERVEKEGKEKMDKLEEEKRQVAKERKEAIAEYETMMRLIMETHKNEQIAQARELHQIKMNNIEELRKMKQIENDKNLEQLKNNNALLIKDVRMQQTTDLVLLFSRMLIEPITMIQSDLNSISTAMIDWTENNEAMPIIISPFTDGIHENCTLIRGKAMTFNQKLVIFSNVNRAIRDVLMKTQKKMLDCLGQRRFNEMIARFQKSIEQNNAADVHKYIETTNDLLNETRQLTIGYNSEILNVLSRETQPSLSN